jgi:hypothetical protein
MVLKYAFGSSYISVRPMLEEYLAVQLAFLQAPLTPLYIEAAFLHRFNGHHDFLTSIYRPTEGYLL